MITLETIETKSLTDQDIVAIHECIHSDAKFFQLNAYVYYPEIKSGCRQLEISGIKFREQNKLKNSVYADHAKHGSKITWGIRESETWILIEDGVIKNI